MPNFVGETGRPGEPLRFGARARVGARVEARVEAGVTTLRSRTDFRIPTDRSDRLRGAGHRRSDSPAAGLGVFGPRYDGVGTGTLGTSRPGVARRRCRGC
jgi:hypothetical protein